jgi:hypothetical protein
MMSFLDGASRLQSSSIDVTPVTKCVAPSARRLDRWRLDGGLFTTATEPVAVRPAGRQRYDVSRSLCITTTSTLADTNSAPPKIRICRG